MKKIEANFFNDWIEILKNDLLNRGYTINDDWDNHKVSNYYFNLVRRLIEPKKRNVLRSNVFTCPTEHQNGLNLIVCKIESGIDLTPHLSKSIRNLIYDDDLLNDWGIYHLHLGTELEDQSEFIKRTGPLLYVRFDNDNAYLINVFNHQSWTKLDIIRIIHNNWPDSIEPYRLTDVIGLEYPPTDHDIKELRNAHINSLVELDQGIVYIPLGGGLASSGFSNEAVGITRRYQKLINKIESHLKENIDSIIEKNNLTQFKDLDELDFKMQVFNNKFYAIESQTRVAINYGEMI
ncbi:hypothetical protein [Tunicatimonas pelagia]|uniref:hypothetical protein n=1 Tax=Tunicatimonas pelagia TaxID=931531 RepID=UPI00266709B1|nr:hypothetical protein [Tunicatimonas pelagia]WKN40526.1 hypothetical protein P0M28_15910 [Tunicatimonas pelagia]